MINIIDTKKRFENTKENFLVIPVDCNGEIDTRVWNKIIKDYSHVEREYLKYIRKCEKDKLEMLGTTRFIPVDVWALVMVDDKSKVVEAYDDPYQYIVLAFVQEFYGKDSMIDIIAVKRILEDIKYKAEIIGASVSIPYNFACGKNLKWHEVSKMIEEVFKESAVEFNIYK